MGAGPVGLTAAMDLDARGISTLVVESRAFLEPAAYVGYRSVYV